MLINFDEAIQKILDSEIPSIGSEKIVFSNSIDRVLDEDIFAEESMPLAPLSSMDGYAFNFEDLEFFRNNGLIITQDNPAGSDFSDLKPQSAIKTFTGSLMPKNSDTLVIVEDVEVREGRIFLKSDVSLKRGDWVRQIGDNYKEGDLLLQRSCKITPYEIGLLAELNRVFVKVKQKPRVGILTSGNEIIEVGERREHLGQVRSSNNHILSAMIEKMGGSALIYSNTKDDFESLRRIFAQMLRECDFIVTTGGMSKGDYDFTQDVILESSNIVFKGVNIKPGKPTMFAIDKKSNKPILGLSGNPNAVAITFYLFGKTIMAKMLQQNSTPLKIVRAKLVEDVVKNDDRVEFRSCFISQVDGIYHTSFANKKKNQSAIINNLCGESALAILDHKILEKNQEVKVILFKEF
ncbi:MULTISPECIES: molybdopterin molybdotransferase MoeA [unclassified Helicobacter]|uniref:molybdopterin molybdotransferase MoeA n=1 Tax=unclassified Helicobacter TaxID=2593540 RepID=UPI000CF11201|nr:MULTISPECIES: molybdopterin molybdotransferase MoeA [unclassified Helicobacter]